MYDNLFPSKFVGTVFEIVLMLFSTSALTHTHKNDPIRSSKLQTMFMTDINEFTSHRTTNGTKSELQMTNILYYLSIF